jgi:DNA-binding NarL/FixJ family response regulator
MVRIVLWVDRPIIRDAIRALLNEADEVAIVGEAHDLRDERDDRIARLSPDVILVDQQLRGGDSDGIAIAASIIRRHGDRAPGVVLLADSAHDADVGRAAKAGIRGYLLEDDDTWILIAGIKAVASGEAWLSARAANGLLREYRRGGALEHRELQPEVDCLTARERSVIRLVALGRSNAEIAAELVLGRATVKTHVSRMLTKLKLRDRTQLAAFAHHNGLV